MNYWEGKIKDAGEKKQKKDKENRYWKIKWNGNKEAKKMQYINYTSNKFVRKTGREEGRDGRKNSELLDFSPAIHCIWSCTADQWSKVQKKIILYFGKDTYEYLMEARQKVLQLEWNSIVTLWGKIQELPQLLGQTRLSNWK